MQPDNGTVVQLDLVLLQARAALSICADSFPDDAAFPRVQCSREKRDSIVEAISERGVGVAVAEKSDLHGSASFYF